MSAQAPPPCDRDESLVAWCPMCRRAVDEWAPGPNGRPNAQCPYCQSLERNRMLILALEGLDEVFATTRTLLDVAPTPGVDAALVRCVGEDRYIGFDLGLDERDIDVLGDLTNLPFADGSIDVLVAFHVLEHIPDDFAAMAEMRRVLGSTGIGLVQVPQRPGPTDEDPDASIEERIRRFGRYDHVRFYGDDFEDRLRAAGLGVATYHAGNEIPRDLLVQARAHGRFSLVTGVADDPPRAADLIAAVLERRRSAGFDPATSGRPSADARMLAGELRLVRRDLEVHQEAFRAMRRRARRAEAQLRRREGGVGSRARHMASEIKRRVLEIDGGEMVAKLGRVARDPRRLLRRARGRLS